MKFPITITEEIVNKIAQEYIEAEERGQHLYALQAEAILDFLNQCNDNQGE